MDCGRRKLAQMAVGLAAGVAAPNAGASRDSTPGRRGMPVVPAGRARISRLVAGSNPVFGGSHSTKRLGELMRDYFTLDRTIEFLLRCEQEGINTFQSVYLPKTRDAFHAIREQGSQMQWICLAAEDRDKHIWNEILALKPLAIAHRGDVTDEFFQTGRQGKIHDYIKKVHDAGVMAAISTHDPEFLLRAADSGWEEDFYMCSFYNVYRTPEQIRTRLGDDMLDELYLASDPRRMAEAIRRVPKLCLTFKILAAGRLCGSAASVESAFQFAFRSIKPADAVIVGMYPVLFDEVRVDSALARKYGGFPAA
jgi:hypothetical protein